MDYKVSILAMAIAMGASGAALADSYDGANVVTVTDTPSLVFINYGFDATGHPLHNDQLNPDGTFKAPCPGCYFKNSTSLTPAEQAAVDADPKAVKFDTKTGKYVSVTTDSTTGDSFGVSKTNSGVMTAVSFGNKDGNSSVFSANGVSVVDTHGNTATVGASGVSFNDASGNSSTTSATGIVVKDAHGNSSVINADGATFTGSTVTVTNASGTSKTTIHDGSVTATGPISGGEIYSGTFSGNSLTGGNAEIGSALNSYGVAITGLQGRMNKVEGGVALAMASKVPSLETGKTFGLTVNAADFDGTGAIAGGIALRLDKNWQINASGGAGFKGGASGGTVGIVGQW
jgi:hypothetical protein